LRKNILITGASSGLGAGMAREFAGLGRNLALCARRTDLLVALRSELRRTAPEVKVVIRQLDVTNHSAVFSVFNEFRDELGGLDRIVVNAGRAAGQPLGTGHFATNRQIAETNFLAALAQCEAAMGILREQRAGHLVMISSVAAMRGFPGHRTTYAATKAGVATLAEGLRIETRRTSIEITTIYPAFIRSPLNEQRRQKPFLTETGKGCRLMVKAIEREPAHATVPAWPWRPIGFALRHLPLALAARLTRAFL
jgi:NADP-dependent 3-hydroxy acid dehydrogenase YdfG